MARFAVSALLPCPRVPECASFRVRVCPASELQSMQPAVEPQLQLVALNAHRRSDSQSALPRRRARLCIEAPRPPCRPRGAASPAAGPGTSRMPAPLLLRQPVAMRSVLRAWARPEPRSKQPRPLLQLATHCARSCAPRTRSTNTQSELGPRREPKGSCLSCVAQGRMLCSPRQPHADFHPSPPLRVSPCFVAGRSPRSPRTWRPLTASARRSWTQE